MMIIGFTGTSHGMTVAQFETVRDLLKGFYPLTIHHGDCIGADAQVHSIALALDTSIQIHPPLDSSKRAMCSGANIMHFARPYLERNREIVKAGIQGLIATPFQDHEILRSGTWATVRYARKLKRHIWIVWPDGSIKEE
jgi:hypothetical protein